MVRSRSFLVEPPAGAADGGRTQRALVPVADLFNHQPEAPAEWAAAEAAAAAAAAGEEERGLMAGENPWRLVEGDDGLRCARRGGARSSAHARPRRHACAVTNARPR